MLVVFVVQRMHVADSEGHPFHLALSAPFYWLWLFKEMIKSGLRVTQLVWSPTMKINPDFAWVPSTQNCDLGRAIYANSITLTPGTVCVRVLENKMFIHALEKDSIAELKDGNMDRRVTKLASVKS